jgi:tetratricopeptide (TPR) repeat protein
VNRRLLREDAGLAIDVKVLRVSALKYLENGRYEDSRQLFEQIMDAGTASAQVLSETGYVYWLLGKASDAEQYFLKALEIDPRHENSLINITEMHLRVGRMVEANEYLDRLLVHYSDHATSHIVNARKQFVAGDRTMALTIISNTVEKWVSDISIQLAAAKLLFQYQCYYDAVSLAERNIRNDNQHADFFEIWGKGLIEINHFEKADGVFSSMRSLYSNHAAPLCGLATVRMLVRDFRSAEAFLEQALDKHSEDAEVIQLYFLTLMSLNDWEKLARVSRPFLEREETLIRPLVFHLIALGKLGRHDEAGEVLRYKLGQAREDQAAVTSIVERIKGKFDDGLSRSNLDIKSLLAGDSTNGDGTKWGRN